MVELPEPVKVSPVIKFFRYSLLIAGIFYGATKRKIYKAMEDKHRAREAALAPERARKLQEEKEAAAERDLQTIIDIFKPKSKQVEVKFTDITDRISPMPGLTEIKSTAKDEHKIDKMEDAKTEDNKFRDEDPEICMTPFDGQNMEAGIPPQDSADSTAPTQETCDIYSKPINLNEKSSSDNNVQIEAGDKTDDSNENGYFIEKHPEELMKPEENPEFKSPKDL